MERKCRRANWNEFQFATCLRVHISVSASYSSYLYVYGSGVRFLKHVCIQIDMFVSHLSIDIVIEHAELLH